MAGLGGLVAAGGMSDPSAEAIEASDIIKKTTARARFMFILLMVGDSPETV
jgi:hypothetical protein